MITKEMIQKVRSPKELRKFVTEFIKDKNKIREERHKGILKKGFYKELIDELVPLSIFCEMKYDEDVVVNLIVGSQPYDAEIKKKDDDILIDRIEITTPCDGATNAEEARKVVNIGFGFFQSGKPGEEVEELIPFIKKTCEQKAIKDYSDCIFLISISYIPPFDEFKEIYDEKIEKVIKVIKEFTFRAKKVYLLIAYEQRLFEVTY